MGLRRKRIICALGCVILLSGCENLNQKATEIKGDIVGNEYIIDTFDNSGEKTMTTHGEQINVEPNITETTTYNADDGWGHVEEISDAITINIDGHQIISCGDTTIFYDKDLIPEYTFYDKIDSVDGKLDSSTLISGIVNSVKNSFGKSVVVVIKSQLGTPIYAFSGNSVYWDIPENLPNFTKLSIDGRALYIHRANFQIIDKELLN